MENYKDTLTKQMVNGSNEEPINCANDTQMVEEGLRQPLLSFKWLVKTTEDGKVVRIGKDYIVKSDEERKQLNDVPMATKNYKFENNQSFHCEDKPILKLKVYVKNTGLNKHECNENTPLHKRRNFFKTTYIFNCDVDDIFAIVKNLKERHKLIITKLCYNSVNLNLSNYGL